MKSLVALLLASSLLIATHAFAQGTPAGARPILVQGAMDVETAALVARLDQVTLDRVGPWSFWRGTVDGHPVIVSKTLKGVSNAAAATMIAIERYRPAAIINQGTAGGLDPALKLYDIVLGTSAINIGAFKTPYRPAGAGTSALDWVPLDLTAADGSASKDRKPARFAGDEGLLAVARRAKASYTRGRVVEGVIGTSDMWNDEVDRLARFHKDYGTVAEEMETASSAQIASQLNVPFLGIRIVSDNAMNGTPFDPRTGEACLDFVYQVVKSYVAQSRSASASAGAPSLVGAWRLVAWDEKRADGTTHRNPRSVGSLMYSDSGRMCGVIMDPARPSWQARPDEAALRAAFNGLVAYCGAYEIHAADGFVLHRVDVEKSPLNVGLTRKRWFTFEGPDRLVLRVDPAEIGPATAESRLVWERVSSTPPR
jgi:adenosylhomocysteine nucleosidase